MQTELTPQNWSIFDISKSFACSVANNLKIRFENFRSSVIIQKIDIFQILIMMLRSFKQNALLGHVWCRQVTVLSVIARLKQNMQDTVVVSEGQRWKADRLIDLTLRSQVKYEKLHCQHVLSLHIA